MKTLEELHHYFIHTLIPQIQPLEESRKKMVRKIIIAQFSVALGAIGFLIVFWGSYSRTGSFENIKTILIFWACLAFFIEWILTKGYRSEFKDQVIEKIIEFTDPNLTYCKSKYIEQHNYTYSRLFPHRLEFYEGDDFVSGRMDKTDIQFSELHTGYYVRTKNGRRRVTVFKGLFFAADFNKSFQGHTLVLPDMAERVFGNLGSMLQSWNQSRGELIKLEDPEFEKEFAVYGSDQIEARYVLSTSLMKRIVDFKRSHRRKVFLSFVGSQVFVAICYAKNLFEAKIFTSLLSFAPIQEYFSDLTLALGIVEDLNLNTRIWIKA